MTATTVDVGRFNELVTENAQLREALNLLRPAHHIPYVDEEHQGGNCVDWVLPLLSRLFKAEGAIAQARRWCDKTEAAAKSEPLSLTADEAVFQARMQLVDEVRALLPEVSS